FHIEVDGVSVTGTITVPNTGAWTTYQYVGQSGISLTAGTHILKIQSDQQYFDLNSIRITADVDTQPPTVSISAPASGATVSATATDNVGVVGVQFKLDGVNLGAESTSAPYSVSWNTTSASNGSHSLTAVARDAAGNIGTSSAVGVTVSNDPPVLSAIASS